MSHAKTRLLPNVASNIIALGFGVVVALWQTPYLMAWLGVEAYGQIYVLKYISDYAFLLTFAITSTVYRFVSIEIDRNDYAAAGRYFSSAFFGLLLIGAAMVVLAGLARTLLPGWIQTPPRLQTEVGDLLVLMMLSAAAIAVAAPFMSIPVAQHRFDRINLLRILGLSLQVALLILFFTAWPTRLTHVGWAYAIKELAVLAGLIVLARQLAPRLRPVWRDVRWTAIRDMAGMSFWSSVDRLGFLLYFSIDLVIITRLLGSVPCGRYAPVAQMALMLSMLVFAIVNVFWPIAYEYIAKERIDDLVRHIQRTTKLVGLLLALPVGIVCGLAAPILSVWLGADWAREASVVLLLIAPLALNFSVRHLFSLTHAMNRVKVPAIVMLTGGVLNLVLSILLIRHTSLGVYGVALATGIALTLRNMLATPLYAAHITGKPWTTFYRGLAFGPCTTAALIVAGLLLTRLIAPYTLAGTALAAAGLVALYAAITFCLLSHEEKRELRSLLSRDSQD
jgi:membrane protein EpsK